MKLSESRASVLFRYYGEITFKITLYYGPMENITTIMTPRNVTLHLSTVIFESLN